MTVSSLSKLASDLIFPLIKDRSAATSELQELAEMICRAQQALHQLPEIDQGRIAELKQAVDSHQIALDAGALACNMLDFHRRQQ